MAKTILVTSCKGGIGKSTVAANLALSLAMAGFSVAAVDCDFHTRCLELIFGCESKTVFNLYDVIQDRCTLERALVRDMRANSLFFLAAASDRQACITSDDFSGLIHRLGRFEGDRSAIDYIVIDAPADEDTVAMCAPVCDEAVIVCSHMPAALRAASLTSMLLGKHTSCTQRLLINSFDAKGVLEKGRAGITEMIDTSKVRLLGIIPFELDLMIYQEKGELIDRLPRQSLARTAFANVAKRLVGEQIPLFEGFSGKEYKKILEAGR